MECEKLTCTDIEAIKHLQPEGWPDITPAFRYYCTHDFCNPVKVKIQHKIVGIGNSIRFDSSAWLAHIIVNSEYRNRGIGYQIVDFLTSEIRSRHIETILLIATDLGEPVYIKAGFRKISDYRFFIRNSSSGDINITDHIQPYRPAFYNDVIQLDNYISGEHREKLLKDYLDKAFVFLNNNVVNGYYLPELGEGPIFARTWEAGRELMRFKFSIIDHAALPAENLATIDFIKEIGFIEILKTGKRMILGKDIAWKPGMIYNRIGGKLG